MWRARTDPEPAPGRLAGWEAWLTVATAVLLAALIVVGWGLAPEAARSTFVDAGWLVGLGCVLVLVVHLAANPALGRPVRRAWATLGAGGGVIWTVVALSAFLPLVAPEAARAAQPAQAPLVLAALILLVVGLHRFPAVPATAADRLRQWVEGAIVFAGTALVFWELVVADDLADARGTLPFDQVVLTLLTPGLLAVLMVSVLAAVAREREAEARRVLGRLAAGALVIMAAGCVRALSGFAPAAAPPLWDVAAPWAGVVMVAAAAAHEAARVRHGDRPTAAVAPGREVRALGLLAGVAVVAGYAMLLASGLREADLRVGGLLVGAAAITALLMARQWLTLREKAALSARLATQALTDELTGLGNRRALLEAGADPVEGLAVVVFDVDDFKAVNDTHGHAVGDAVLREIAARCRREVRGGDVLGRLGGDEFVVLLPGAGVEGARRVGDALGAAVAAAPIDAGGVAVPVTVSLGVAAAPPEDLTALLARADQALYEAKRAGRDVVTRVADGV
ncbi:MAG: GGDEF domain-containing protein [Solirubrobacteraceae bacterium MAG38_C4-C5]|nr:GGDEF domain-containing protein [Candidatus Siliceabacter maunaloa]